ncbi:hypothetical protein N5W20_05450 [Candidatus Kirkpatrickella diaphorinae]|uniref:Holin n=1 Tax=Candidatus Kirkpatrickella diaphorinae TaxID=2984322 RepID=A0ABY6GGZ5_9PROT|nr:hypothetical protein [Candidatus Kirkpatrickella diaphorinae]UYH50574.1 hypothetical protein N5W20_05450 [Candidatus Kirkpatrickella diaphorinae]
MNKLKWGALCGLVATIATSAETYLAEPNTAALSTVIMAVVTTALKVVDVFQGRRKSLDGN